MGWGGRLVWKREFKRRGELLGAGESCSHTRWRLGGKWPCVRQEEHLCLLPQHTKGREEAAAGVGRSVVVVMAVSGGEEGRLRGWGCPGRKSTDSNMSGGLTKHHTLDLNGPNLGLSATAQH